MIYALQVLIKLKKSNSDFSTFKRNSSVLIQQKYRLRTFWTTLVFIEGLFLKFWPEFDYFLNLRKTFL